MEKRNGPEFVLCEFEELYLISLVSSKPGIYLKEVQQMLADYTGRIVHVSTICRALHRLGFSRQRIKITSSLRSDDLRAEFIAEMSAFDPSFMQWIDESGFDKRNHLRKYGYGVRGQPPRNYTLTLRGKRYTSIAVLTTNGVEDVYITESSVDGDVFLDFVRRCMLPLLMPFNGTNPNSIVVMDNASIHHIDPVFELLTAVGALVKFLPAYSPDLNPIEEVFAEAKHYLEANDTSAVSPKTAILSAYHSVSVDNCLSYIEHAGYIV
ncbi:uncharacterized protein [Dysidea avara]|uniref:uncharacterized protein n=1 Tax=Dysidea avara TaxID=196820 RepID=UPI00333021C9